MSKLQSSNGQNSYHAQIDLPNGWTASIVCHDGSYGGKNKGALFEVWAWKTAKPNHVMESSEGWLDFKGVVDALDKISKFEA